MRTGWQPMHVIAETAAGEIVGILPLYLKGHSQGEYVFDHGWAQGFEHAGGRYYPKLLNAVPFTPVTGRRIFTKAQNLKSSNSATAKDNHSSSAHDARIQDALISHALSYLKAKQISSFHMNFIEPELAPALEGAGFLLRRDTQFHWVNNGYDNFDDFLETLQSRKRKALRKERRAALEGGICVEWVEGEKLTPKHWDQIYDFYLDTGERK